MIVDDFVRPTLMRFTRDDHDALRILAGSAFEVLGPWRLLGSGSLAGPLDASHASTLGMGAYIAALSDDRKDDPGPQGTRAGSDGTVFGDIPKDESAPT
ncbi:hypothetical protein ACU8V3_13440 [Cobetia marina]